MTALEGELERDPLAVGDGPAGVATDLEAIFWPSGAINGVAAGSVGTAAQAAELSDCRVRAWRQQALVVLALVFSDLLLASLVWGMAILVQSGGRDRY